MARKKAKIRQARGSEIGETLLAYLLYLLPRVAAFFAVGLTVTGRESGYHPPWLAHVIGFGIATLVVGVAALFGGGNAWDTFWCVLVFMVFFLVGWGVFTGWADRHKPVKSAALWRGLHGRQPNKVLHPT